MLHFIVQAIENRHTDLLLFSDEFYSVADGVSKCELVYFCLINEKELNVSSSSILVNIPELQQQLKEIRRELKYAREELHMAKNPDERVEGDKLAESIEVLKANSDNDL